MGLAAMRDEARRTPLWAIAAAALLSVVGVTRSEGTRKPRVQRAVDDHTSGQSSASEADRDRRAPAPTEIPAKGWKDVALRIYNGISEDRILALAAGVTFYVLLALFPGIAGLIALYGLYADASTISQHLDTLAGVLPEGGLQIIREQIERLAAATRNRDNHRIGRVALEREWRDEGDV